jgi:hypothetical protein
MASDGDANLLAAPGNLFRGRSFEKVPAQGLFRGRSFEKVRGRGLFEKSVP